MQKLHDANDTFAHLLQSFAALMSERPDDAELDDRTAPQYDEEIRALQLVQKALERRIALVCQKRNTFPPINSLPPELLVNIFALAASYIWGTVPSDNATLSLVCRYWNRLVDTTPSLWTRIDEGTMSVARMTQAIKKSQNAPLEIACTSWLFAQVKRGTVPSELLRHTHRWRELSLALENADEALDLITTSTMPLLEYLSLSVDGYFGWVRPEPLDLFGGRPPPRLRQLYLWVIPITWNPTTLCNLTTLSISRIRTLGPSLDQLMGVLSACPDMESLSISDVTFSGDASTSSSNPIHLPALAKLGLRMLTTAITNRLLALIHAPNCISRDLHCDIQGDPLQTLFTPDVSHFFDPIRSNPSTGSISCDPDRFNISLIGPWCITINVENITFVKDTLIWLSPRSRVQLTTSGLTLPLDDLAAVAADMEVVYRIAFGYGDPVSEALTLLATCNSVQGRTRWLFPALEEMSIGNDVAGDGDELEKLLLMLRRRNETQATEDNAQRPKPLRKLTFGLDWNFGADDPAIVNFHSTYWPSYLNEIRSLLGPEGELIWYGKFVTEEGVLEDRVGFQD